MEELIAVIESGSVIVVKLGQQLKAACPILVTEFGMFTEDKLQ
jgi:hypothetical protein